MAMPAPKNTNPSRKNVNAKRVSFPMDLTAKHYDDTTLGGIDGIHYGKLKRYRPNVDAGARMAMMVTTSFQDFESKQLQNELTEIRQATQEVFNSRENIQNRFDQLVEQEKAMELINEQNESNYEIIQQHHGNLTDFVNTLEEDNNSQRQRFDDTGKSIDRQTKFQLENEKEHQQLLEREAELIADIAQIRANDKQVSDEIESITRQIEEAKIEEETIQQQIDESRRKTDVYAENERELQDRIKAIEDDYIDKLKQKTAYRDRLSQSKEDHFKKCQQTLDKQAQINRQLRKKIEKLRNERATTDKENCPKLPIEESITTTRSHSNSSGSIVESSNGGGQPSLFRKTELKCTSSSPEDRSNLGECSQARNTVDEPILNSDGSQVSVISNTPGIVPSSLPKLNSPYSVPDSSVAGSIRKSALDTERKNDDD